MLSEIIFAGTKPNQRKRADGSPYGLSCSQLFPCPRRLYLIEKGKTEQEEVTPQQLLNMEDGWDAEEQAVRRLARAGVTINNRGFSVSLGRSSISGKIDGTFSIDGNNWLWEHKAMSTDWFYLLKAKGLRAFPGYKTQVQAYMRGMSLDKAILQAKHKDYNDIFDVEEIADPDYINPIIEWADKIRLDNWVPEPEKCIWCAYCGFGCFGTVVDFTGIGQVTSEPDIIDKWRKGKQLQAMGKVWEDEAREYFISKLGEEQDFAIINGELKIQRVYQNRFSINKQKLLELYGPASLVKVGEDKRIVMYQIREVN